MKVISNEVKKIFLTYDLILRSGDENDELKKILTPKSSLFKIDNEFDNIIKRMNKFENNINKEIYNHNYGISLKSINELIMHTYKENNSIHNNDLSLILCHVLDILEMNNINYIQINNSILDDKKDFLRLSEINNIVYHLTLIKDLIKIISKSIPIESNANEQFDLVLNEFLSLIIDIDILQKYSGLDNEGNILGYDIFEAINNSFQNLFIHFNFNEAVLFNELIINFTFYSRILSLLFSKIKMKKYIIENSSDPLYTHIADGRFEMITSEYNYKLIFISNQKYKNKKIFYILNKKNIDLVFNDFYIFKNINYKSYKNLPNNIFWGKLYKEIKSCEKVN